MKTITITLSDDNLPQCLAEAATAILQKYPRAPASSGPSRIATDILSILCPVCEGNCKLGHAQHIPCPVCHGTGWDRPFSAVLDEVAQQAESASPPDPNEDEDEGGS